MMRPDCRITYIPRFGTTPESELRTLSAVYAYLLDSKKAVESTPEPDGRDDTKESNGCIAYPNHNS